MPSSKHLAKKIDLVDSYIRLNVPDQTKIGGGHRVKLISMNDSWKVSSGEENSEYGQVYDYTMMENNEVIRSGVASYEPMAGGEEIPQRLAESLVMPNNPYFEEPINENLSKVLSLNI